MAVSKHNLWKRKKNGLMKLVRSNREWLQKRREMKIRKIDTDRGSLKVLLSNKELVKRKKKWRPKKMQYTTGTIWKYSQSVGPAFKGAVTHPGASKEKRCYADI